MLATGDAGIVRVHKIVVIIILLVFNPVHSISTIVIFVARLAVSAMPDGLYAVPLLLGKHIQNVATRYLAIVIFRNSPEYIFEQVFRC